LDLDQGRGGRAGDTVVRQIRGSVMSAAGKKLTLSGLQRRLSRLAPGQQLCIAGVSYRDLFGEADSAAARARRFAHELCCELRGGDSLVVFRKGAAAASPGGD